MRHTHSTHAEKCVLYFVPQRFQILPAMTSRRNILRTLCTFCVFVLVAGRSHGSSIFGITSQLQLFVSSGAAQVSIRDRPHPNHGKLQSSDKRIEITEVSPETSEKGRDICNSDELRLVGTESECAQPKSDILDYEIEMEVEPSYELIAGYPSPIQDIRNDTFIKRALSTYMHFLGTHELATKCITSGIIGGAGDICAQIFEQRMAKGVAGGVAAFSISSLLLHIDKRRVFGTFFESTFMSGPLMHYAYNYMEYLVPVHEIDGDEARKKNVGEHEQEGDTTELSTVSSSSLKQWAAASFHVLLDIILLGPIFVLSMMSTTSFIEGKFRTLGRELMMDFGPTLWASTLASIGFIPTQLLAFRLLPLRFRLLYMNVQDIVWNAIVSFMAHRSR